MRISLSLILTVLAGSGLGACSILTSAPEPIDREAVVTRHNPVVHELDPQAAMTLGNGRFAFTADATGLQTYPEYFFAEGIPLETKARWAWHSRANTGDYNLEDVAENYAAYGRQVAFPTQMDGPAGQWLRQNPHDLPLAKVGFSFAGGPLTEEPEQVQQTLDLWRGQLHSRFRWQSTDVDVDTLVSQDKDALLVDVTSALLLERQLAVDIHFPRGYDLQVKNTPSVLYQPDREHLTRVLEQGPAHVLFQRQVDDSRHFVLVRWQGQASLTRVAQHLYRLQSGNGGRLRFAVEFSAERPAVSALDWTGEQTANRAAWAEFWQSGAFLDLAGSRHPQAAELERRIILSRYLMASQARADIPAQETGLTNSSWYGKHHTEMLWWHTAHWVLWQQPTQVERVLDWLQGHLAEAQEVAEQRGLEGARWAKMVGPGNRESPGGNPLIIWNQPQPIHLAELLYRASGDTDVLVRYGELVDQTAEAMVSMLVWEEDAQRFSLAPPIWIAQELYDPKASGNPTFELAYWRAGLTIASQWRMRQGKPVPPLWQKVLAQLAPLPVKDGRYVSIESIPDTFDNRVSRQDHPSMLAAYGLLNDPGVDPGVMAATLRAVLQSWDWEQKIWGWDYPMIAMTAARLNEPEIAVDILLSSLVHNRYLVNGHVPQAGAGLRVYLPANGALLAAVAMMVGGWQGAPERPFPGFPEDGLWQIKAEGFRPLL